MRTVYEYRIRDESIESQIKGNRYNPNKVISYKGKEYECGIGTNDCFRVFVEGEYLIVFAFNFGLGYTGIDVYSLETQEEVGNIFLQDYEAEEVIGENWDDLSYITLAKRMMDHLY